MKLTAVIYGALLLTACASEPDSYAVAPSQRGGAAQALAQCRAQSYSVSANPAANPLFAAAYQQQFVVDCMRAAGYEAR